MNYKDFFNHHLSLLKQDGRYRIFADLERPVGQAPYAIWHHENRQDRVIIWCSNDYMGMSHHPEVVQTMIEGTRKFGAGAGGTRNISGTAHPHVLLEKTVADLHQKEAGLIFSSGYAANEATISALASSLPNCLILSDEKNHASVIQGIRNSRADKIILKHNNLSDLEKHLKAAGHARPKIVVFTSVYSMDGDIAPIAEICQLCRDYNALSYVDEVHAVGMYGPKGAGIVSALELENEIDIIQGNFAKAYGVVGGYIAADASTVDFVRSFASGFIFTTSMPPSVALAAKASVDYLTTDMSKRQKFWQQVSYLKQQLEKTTLPVIKNDSHIVPIVVGNALHCRQITDSLLQNHKIYVQPINYPTVPRGQERLRLTVTPHHTNDHIDQLIDALISVFAQTKHQAAA